MKKILALLIMLTMILSMCTITANANDVSITLPTETEYMQRFSVTDTNAVFVAIIRKSADAKVRDYGITLLDENNKVIKSMKNVISSPKTGEEEMFISLDVNNDLRITLSPNTTYKYFFNAIVDDKSISSDTYSFKTSYKSSRENKEWIYMITFNPNGGNISYDSKNVKIDTLVGELPKPTKEGFNFLGWFTEKDGGKKIEEKTKYKEHYDMTLYAQWENTEKNNQILMWIGKPEFLLNGKSYLIDTLGTTPVVKSDRTLVPIRAIVEAMGGEVAWDEKSQIVTIKCGVTTIKMRINGNYATVNGEQKYLDVPPRIIGSRTMVPVRFVTENLNAKVDWEPDTKEVKITY